MEYFIKNCEDIKIKILNSQTINNKSYALLERKSKSYITYITAYNYKINGMLIEWDYGDYSSLIDINNKTEQRKTYLRQLGLFYITLASKI